MTILASVNNKTVMPGITPIADVPDAPTIGTATAAGLAASITFTAATTGGTPTTFTATSNPGSLTGTASSSPVTVSGLTEGTSYTFTVRANNSTGSSANSAASNSITAVEPLSGGYDALATVIVPSGGLSSITFGGIPTGYKHLQIRYIARSDGSTDGSYNVQARLNYDSSSSYAFHLINGDGANSSYYGAGSQTSLYFGNVTSAYSGFNLANAFGTNVVDILDYSNTNKTKTIRYLNGYDVNGAGKIQLVSNLWNNTSAVSSISINPQVGNWTQYSQFALYGVK